MVELSRSRADNERLRIFMRLQRDVRGPSDPRNDPSGRFLASTERRSIPCYPASNCCVEDGNAKISLAGNSRLGNYGAEIKGRSECARSTVVR